MFIVESHCLSLSQATLEQPSSYAAPPEPLMQEPPEGEKRLRADAAEEQAARCRFCCCYLIDGLCMVVNFGLVTNNGYLYVYIYIDIHMVAPPKDRPI